MTLPASTTRGAAALSRFACLALPAWPAQAHHAMEGRMPQSGWEGLLSGLAHPVIGFDHFLFLLGAAVVVAAARLPQHMARWALALFAAAGLAGTLLHVHGLDLPAAEAGVAISLLVAAAVLLRQPGRALWVAALAAPAGLLHGHAYGESVVGAQAGPLLAYLLGLTLVQAALLLGLHAAGCRLAMRQPALLARLRQGLALLLGLAGAWSLLG